MFHLCLNNFQFSVRFVVKVSGCGRLTPGMRGVGTLAGCKGDELASSRCDMLARVMQRVMQ